MLEEAVEEKYRLQLNAKDEQIRIYLQQNTNLLEIIKLQASQPININNSNYTLRIGFSMICVFLQSGARHFRKYSKLQIIVIPNSEFRSVSRDAVAFAQASRQTQQVPSSGIISEGLRESFRAASTPNSELMLV